MRAPLPAGIQGAMADIKYAPEDLEAISSQCGASIQIQGIALGVAVDPIGNVVRDRVLLSRFPFKGMLSHALSTHVPFQQ